MYWIFQAMEIALDWFDRLLDTGERGYLVTLENAAGLRWQVEVLALGSDAARILVGEEYPRDRVLDVQPLD